MNDQTPIVAYTKVAETSAAIAGFKVTTRNRHDPEYQALLEVYKHLFGASVPNLTDPRIVNAIICLTGGSFRWRTGIPAEFKGIPKAEACRHLYRLWWQKTTAEADTLQEAPEDKKDAFCNDAYSMLLCIRPFRNSNGRTALVLWYMLRNYLGLPLKLVTYKEAPALLEYVRRDRKNIFLPAVVGRSFMPRS